MQGIRTSNGQLNKHISEPMNGGILAQQQNRVELFNNSSREKMVDVKILKTYFDTTNKNIKNIIDRFLKTDEIAQEKYQKGMDIFQNDPASMLIKYGLTNVKDFEPFHKSITIGVISIAKEAAEAAFILMAKARTEIIANADACTDLVFKDFKTISDARLLALEVIEKKEKRNRP